MSKVSDMSSISMLQRVFSITFIELEELEEQEEGLATTFLTNHNEGIFYDLRNFLAQNDQYIPQELMDHAASKVKPGPTNNEAVPRRKQVVYAQ